MRAAGLKPAAPTFRSSERGSGYGRTSSGYDTSSRPVGLDDTAASMHGGHSRPGMAGDARHSGWRGDAGRASERGRLAGHGGGPAQGTPIGQVDAGLMALIRRLAFTDIGPSAEDSGFAADGPGHSLSGTFGHDGMARRADGTEPDPHAPRRAARSHQRLARSHGDRRHRQPVRPDPVRPEGAAADGAADRAAAVAGAARGARRPELLLVAQASGAPFRQPHRVARQRLRGLRFRIRASAS